LAAEGSTSLAAQFVTELAARVRRRAQNRCEYCLIPQAAFRRPFHIEHILAKQHGGLTQLENLALACWQCNLKKGTNLTSIDPETGELTRLFHPRIDKWTDHFASRMLHSRVGRVQIVGLTPIGRATMRLLDFNEEFRQVLRYEILGGI
jgi:HNH endonuclease